MADGHVAHEENEPDPWHERPFNICSDQVCCNRIDQDDDEAAPQVKQSDEIENGNPTSIQYNDKGNLGR